MSLTSELVHCSVGGFWMNVMILWNFISFNCEWLSCNHIFVQHLKDPAHLLWPLEQNNQTKILDEDRKIIPFSQIRVLHERFYLKAKQWNLRKYIITISRGINLLGSSRRNRQFTQRNVNCKISTPWTTQNSNPAVILEIKSKSYFTIQVIIQLTINAHE